MIIYPDWPCNYPQLEDKPKSKSKSKSKSSSKVKAPEPVVIDDFDKLLAYVMTPKQLSFDEILESEEILQKLTKKLSSENLLKSLDNYIEELKNSPAYNKDIF